MRPTISATPKTTMIVLPAGDRPVFGSASRRASRSRFTPTDQDDEERDDPDDRPDPAARHVTSSVPIRRRSPARDPDPPSGASVLRRAGRRQPADALDEPAQELLGASASTATSTFGGRPQTPRQSVTVSPVVSVPAELDVDGDAPRVRTSVGSRAAATASGSWMNAP